MNDIRCIHRHTIKTHPNCFRKGLIKPENWWEGKRIGYLDIETAQLDADFGIMLTWCIKYRDEKRVRYGAVTRKELFNLEFDKRITEELIAELENLDVVVTYYGRKFDIPFVRTRAIYWGLEFPVFGSIIHWDIWEHVRSKLRLHRNSLEAATVLFEIPGKTHIDPILWTRAKYGNKKALYEVLSHNKQDVVALEGLHKKLERYSRWNRTSI